MTPDIHIRKTTKEDREAVFAISRQIWEGEDYIPALWEKWLGEGGFYVIIHQETIIGCLKVTDHGNGQLAFEGLRMDPAFRGRGLASAATEALMKIAEDLHPRIMRFATGDENKESHHLGKKYGLVQVASFYHRFLKLGGEEEMGESAVFLQPPGPSGEGLVVRKAEGRDLEAVGEFMKTSPDWPYARGLFSHGWVFYELTPEVLERELQEGFSFVALEDGNMTAVLLAHRSEQYPVNLDISWISGTEEAMSVLLRELTQKAWDLGAREIGAKLPSAGTAAFMERHGFVRHEHVNKTLIFEKECW